MTRSKKTRLSSVPAAKVDDAEPNPLVAEEKLHEPPKLLLGSSFYFKKGYSAWPMILVS